MEFQDYFPVWEKLTSVQQQQLKDSAISRTVKKGTILHMVNLATYVGSSQAGF